MHSEETMSRNQISKENMFQSASMVILQVVQMNFLRHSSLYHINNGNNKHNKLLNPLSLVWFTLSYEYLDLFV